MMIFVVGPSRVGKTTLIGKVLDGFPGVRVLDLDDEENRSARLISANGGNPGGWEERWLRNIESIRREEAVGDDLIVDVGAGSLQTVEGRQFFIDRRDSTIAVVAPCEVVYRRHGDRNREEFTRTEYSADRENVYRSAAFSVRSTSGIEQSARKFRQVLRKLLK